MPTASRWLVKSALLHLVAGFSVGAVMLASKAWEAGSSSWALLPAHVELVTVGWTLQLAMGVGAWILPRPSGRPVTWSLAWAAWAMVNGGVIAVIGSLVLLPEVLLPAGRAAELAAATAFAAHAWMRLRPIRAVA